MDIYRNTITISGIARYSFYIKSSRTFFIISHMFMRLTKFLIVCLVLQYKYSLMLDITQGSFIHLSRNGKHDFQATR